MQPTDLANLRRSYLQSTLSEADLAPDPVAQFVVWFAEVRDAGIVEPNALVLGTAGSDARPTARTVLLKDVDERGFTVYTNYSSRKGHDIAANPWVSMLFPWHAVERQVIVTGRAERVPRSESAAYFASRPYGSRIGALASQQSSVIGSRSELEKRYAALARRYPEGTDVPLPDDRLRYIRDVPDGPWIVQRLAP
jgi:pyridoxamine 5'-phosphate oxidase